MPTAWVHFCSYRTSRRSNWQCLLGTILLGTWNSAGWANAQRQNYRWRRRLVQHFLQWNRSWKARPSSCDGRLGTNGSWYVRKKCLLFFWCPLMFKMYPCVLLWFCWLLVFRSHGCTSLLTDLHTMLFLLDDLFCLISYMNLCSSFLWENVYNKFQRKFIDTMLAKRPKSKIHSVWILKQLCYW